MVEEHRDGENGVCAAARTKKKQKQIGERCWDYLKKKQSRHCSGGFCHEGHYVGDVYECVLVNSGFPCLAYRG